MPKRGAAVLLALALALHPQAAPVVHGQGSYPAYPIQWSSVPAVPGASSVDLVEGCICNLLNSSCTPNCCCDPDCAPAVVAGFEAAGACLPEGPPPQQLAYCTPSEPFAQVNLPSGDFYRIDTPAAASGFLPQLLCISADHNPTVGTAYTDPEPGASSSNTAQAECPAALPAAPAAPSSYQYGRVVLANYNASTGKAPFMLPFPALSAECADALALGFLQRVPADLQDTAVRCQRTVAAADFAATCGDAGSPLSPLSATAMQFPPNPAVQSSSLMLSVGTAAVTYVSPANGSALAVTPPAVAAPAYAAPAGGTPATCAGVLSSAAYTFFYTMAEDTGEAQLTSVTVALTITDLALAAGAPAAVLTQSFSVAWAATGTSSASLQAFSGNPGYIPGFPVLAGVNVTNGSLSAVARFVGGLQLPGAAPTGECTPAAPPTPVAFAYNGSSDCGVGMTLSALGAWCGAAGAAADQFVSSALEPVYYAQLANGQVLVGVWGNSNYSQPDQWVALAPSNAAPGPLQWDAATGMCSNVVTGLDITLLMGVSGDGANPQPKLLYGRACFRYGTWRWNAAGPPGATQRFPMSFRVYFKAAAQEAPTSTSKPSPPLATPLPPDLFYPFLT